jgi:hypothetical protein
MKIEIGLGLVTTNRGRPTRIFEISITKNSSGPYLLACIQDVIALSCEVKRKGRDVFGQNFMPVVYRDDYDCNFIRFEVARHVIQSAAWKKFLEYINQWATEFRPKPKRSA